MAKCMTHNRGSDDTDCASCEVQAVFDRLRYVSSKYLKASDEIESFRSRVTSLEAELAEEVADVAEAHDRIASLEAEIERLRQRLFSNRQTDSISHTTACSIWGDDGQGGTNESFAEPLPCNCRALLNHSEREREKFELAEEWRRIWKDKAKQAEAALEAKQRWITIAQNWLADLPKVQWESWCEFENKARAVYDAHDAAKDGPDKISMAERVSEEIDKAIDGANADIAAMNAECEAESAGGETDDSI